MEADRGGIARTSGRTASQVTGEREAHAQQDVSIADGVACRAHLSDGCAAARGCAAPAWGLTYVCAHRMCVSVATRPS